MNILCLDTSGPVLSAALRWEEGVVALEADAGGKHSGLLLPVMDNLLKTAGIRPAAIDVAACMRGPGSFTGIRIGFAAVKGIAAACGAKAVSIPTLDCMALPFMDDGAALDSGAAALGSGAAALDSGAAALGSGAVAVSRTVVPAIDSRRQQFYTAVYRGGQRVTDYLDVKADVLVPALCGGGDKRDKQDAEEILLTGPDAVKLHGALSGLLKGTPLAVDPYYARGQARNMLRFLARGDMMRWDGELAVPLYIRKSDAEEKGQKW